MDEFKPRVTFKSQIRVKQYKPKSKPTDINKPRKKPVEFGDYGASAHDGAAPQKRTQNRRGTMFPRAEKSFNLKDNMKDSGGN